MKYIEKALWSMRWLMIVTVAAVMAGAFVLVGFVVTDFLHLVVVLFDRGFTPETRIEVLLIIIEIVDQALMAGVMLMFGLGIYEIYISKLDVDSGHSSAPKLLVVSSITQLKGKLGAMVIMILIVKFLSLSIEMHIDTPDQLLMYAASVAFLGLALYLTNGKGLPGTKQGDADNG